ncbi:MAG TPA: DUF5916 domain-containing protein [Vicinamibacterales bacterium]|nr:DUF5916 domain-containing protein [Vicinamibacterales bacterium]
MFDLVLALAVTTAVRVTGTVTDEVWQSAPSVADFVQREPQDGGQPSQRTEFRVAYDSATLYVKVRAFDTQAEKIVTYLTRRDANSASDWLHVYVDSYHDRRTAYEFAVNPSGVKIDRYWFNDNNSDDSWDAVWDVAVSRDPQGWTAEFKIPFSQLRFTRAESASFGLAVTREIGRLNETSTWPRLPKSATGYVSSFGELGGLSLTASPKRLELAPYTVANLTRQRPDGNPLLTSSAPGGALGLDARYALTPGLTLTATVNPDFGQVEADPAVVNLTAFETYFNERRPFFVEGSGNFNFNLDCTDGPCSSVFYSRRIGRAPQGTANLPDGDNVYTDVPSQSTILGAAKLTGHVGKYAVGVMQAVTEQQVARVDNEGVVGTQPVQPMTSYTVGRVRREFANQSSVGVMLTSANSQIVDQLTALPSHANAFGADWDLRFKKRYSLTGYLVGSGVSGTAESIDNLQQDSAHYFQRPDETRNVLDPARTSMSGAAGAIAINQIGGEHLRFTSTYNFKSPGFDVNALGYMRRADQRTIDDFLQIRTDKPDRLTRWKMININVSRGWNYEGDPIQSMENINAHTQWKNNWQTGGGVNIGHRTVDDRVTRGGPALLQNPFSNLWHYVNGDQRHRIYLNYFGAYGGGLGFRINDFEPEINYRPVPSLLLTSGMTINHTMQDNQWVGTVSDASNHYVFGHMQQTTVSMTERVNFTLSPTLSLQLYAQPFMSAGDYTNFRQVVDPRAAGYDARYAAYNYDIGANGDPNFNVKSFRTTNVLRWEYKPGSTLFVVWQQARENDAVPGGFAFGRDFSGIFGVAPKNVFLVKLSYWLNY